MDTRSGIITSEENLKQTLSEGEFFRFAVPIDLKNLTQTQRDQLSKSGTIQIKPRTKCPCGSGKRFKSCCMRKSES